MEVLGLLDAAVLDAPGAGIRTYYGGESTPGGDPTDLFFAQDSGFIGVYTDPDPGTGGDFLVVKIGDAWYRAALTQV